MGLTRSRLFSLLLAIAVLVMPLAGQTLADRARELRKTKRTPSANEKVFTNESLNLRPGPAIADNSTASKAPTKPGDSAAAEDEEKPEMTSEEAKAAAAADYKAKIESAKGELATVQRELDIAQRENKLRTAQFYADAGNRLRNEKAFQEEERKNQADMADKQKKMADTQALLERLRGEARRAGVPAGLIP